ncbi:MAG: alpha/beta hydrolase [Oscillospiraceae bacterium]|nr:alpha/beta hydrolase [Oscillospiraceae bacterium]
MLKQWNVTIPALSGNHPRKTYIWLPENYHEEPEKRYPVLYLFDGHNIFRDEFAAFGKSWGMEEYMLRTGKDLIIVAVECNHEGNSRLSEYSPVSYQNKKHGFVPGKAPVYMKWMTEFLKPWVDRTFRTLPDREHTSIGGSSMGGLIALYAVTAYNHIFRQAVCLSPSLWVNPVMLLAMVARGKYTPDTAIFLSYGQNEMGNHPGNRLAIGMAARELYAKGVNLTLRIVRDGYHCEAAWEKEVPIFMDSLNL